MTTANIGRRNLALLWGASVQTAATLAFLVAGGAFSLQLSGLDPHAPVGGESTSTQSQIALAIAFTVLFGLGVRRWRRAAALLRQSGIMLALPGMAILSIVWAPEPAVATRRALAFALTIGCGVAIAARLPGEAALRFLARAMAAALGLSVVYVAVIPAYGVHQIADGVQSLHAGDWRGLFIHRTVLGRLSALCLATSAYGGRRAFGHPAIRSAAIAASGLCIVMAHSGGGVLSAAILLSVPWLLRLWTMATERGRSFAVVLGLALLPAAASIAVVTSPILLAFLGKDATLTGRTPLWALMLEAARERWLLGYGYSTGFRDVVAKIVADHSPFGYVPNAQNGYLDVVLNLGIVGLGLTLALLAAAFWRALRVALGASRSDPLAILPLLIVVFTAEMNLVEATFIAANDIFTLIYATAFVVSGETIRRRRRSDPPPRDAPQLDPAAGTIQ
jgi:O-antigen ligase